jgi:hypothetical protein
MVLLEQVALMHLHVVLLVQKLKLGAVEAQQEGLVVQMQEPLLSLFQAVEHKAVIQPVFLRSDFSNFSRFESPMKYR